MMRTAILLVGLYRLVSKFEEPKNIVHNMHSDSLNFTPFRFDLSLLCDKLRSWPGEAEDRSKSSKKESASKIIFLILFLIFFFS